MSDAPGFEPIHPSHCPDCWAWFHRPDLRPGLASSRRHASGPQEGQVPPKRLSAAPAPRPPAAPPRTLPCVHLGEVVGEQKCPTCTGHVVVKRFACSVYGQTTLGKKLEGVQCCAGCPDYQPKG